MKRTLILLAVIAFSAYSCKKEVNANQSDYSEETMNALQGTWSLDSSLVYYPNQNGVDKDTVLFQLLNAQIVIEDNQYRNINETSSEDWGIFNDYIMVGSTRYEIDVLTSSQFVLTRLPSEGTDTYYTRWFNR